MLRYLNKVVDITMTKDDMSEEDIKAYIKELDHTRPRCLITTPLYLKTAKRYLIGTGIKLGVFIDHPMLGLDIDEKVLMIKRMIELKVDEIYTYISPSIYRDRDYQKAQAEFEKMASFKRSVDIIPIIRPSSFSKDALSKLSRFMHRYRYDTLILDGDAISEDDIITLKVTYRDLRLGIMDGDDLLRYAKLGISRFINDSLTSFKERLYG